MTPSPSIVSRTAAKATAEGSCWKAATPTGTGSATAFYRRRCRVLADGAAEARAHAPAMSATIPHPLSTLPVSGAMHEGVITCDRDSPLTEVARLMSVERVHCVVVVDEDPRRPWGLISDLDLTAAASVRGLTGQTAGGSAATPVVTVSPDESLERAAQLMTEHGVAHLVVVAPDNGRPVGVLSTLDVARAAA